MAKKKKSKPPVDPDAAPAAPPQPAPKPPPDPKWIWPPFPAPPEGANIIPFSQFQPKGIALSLEEETELDGDGIPTVVLQVKHNSLFDGIKHKHGKKKKNPLAEISEEELRKMTWDKRWELGEELRTAKPLDPRESYVERFFESTRLFHQGRRWDPPRQELWDQFRVFSGIISGVKRPQGGKRARYFEDDERPGAEEPGPEDEISDDDDLMKVDNADSPDKVPGVTPDNEEEAKKPRISEKAARNEEVYLDLLAKAEEKPEFWMNETEKATKIFLSSYFRDKGLLWSEPNSRDAPILLRFYFEFVLRNKLFAEKDVTRGYERALQVVHRASLELPFTFKISRAFPDAWGKACSTMWGTRERDPWAVFGDLGSAAPVSSSVVDGLQDENTSEDVNQHELIEAEYDLGENKIHETAISVKDPEVTLEKIVPPVEEGATIEEVEDELDENAPNAENVDPTDDVDGNKDDNYGGWGSNEAEDKKGASWAMEDSDFDEEAAWGKYITPTIFPFVGPSSLPDTHIPIRAEESTRMLVNIIPPDPNSSDPLASSLAVLVFQPWPHPDDDIDSMVKTPKMLPFKEDEVASLAACRKARRFDPKKDDIRVYADPAVMTECKAGMGIGGLWVQVGRRVEDDDQPIEKSDKGRSKKGKGSSSKFDEWWYMETLRHAIPGYWTANDAQRDTTRFENNPDCVYEYSD